jgi:N-methylhydantoinase A
MIAGVDIGGTFTDVVVLDENGLPRAVKVPTTPQDQSAGLVAGLIAAAGAIAEINAVAHGTTTATNAVLERKVARTVLVTTEGFRDVLTIGRQNRPSLYDLDVVRPEPLVPSERVVTVHERVGADGSVLVALTDDEVTRVVEAVADLGAESVALCLLFSFANTTHEQRLATAITDRLGVPVTVSSELLPEFREFERASTCALDAAVAPVMRRYLDRLQERLPGSAVTVMTSAGGVAQAPEVAAAPVHTLLSGPAAGVVAAAAIAREAGFGDAVAFDMGGTSTDVCLITDGAPAIATQGSIGGLPFATPSVAVHTVGAGGGSIAHVDRGGALRVGPRSAGAEPGPACYGKGGLLPTVTDAHAVLGHLVDGQSLGDSGLRLDRAAAGKAMAGLAGFPSATDAADGVVTVVRAAMLRALRRVTTERGVDPAELALVAYGGAGPLHATALARELGCSRALIPPAPGVLSALGLLLAPPRSEASRTVMVDVSRTAPPPDLDEEWAQLEREVRLHLPAATLQRVADCRYAGQSHELRLPLAVDSELAQVLDRAHERAYGYALPDETVQVVTIRVVAEATPALPALPHAWAHPSAGAGSTTPVLVDGTTVSLPVLARGDLRSGDRLEGPALIAQADAMTLLSAGERATVGAGGTLVVTW